jgi:hypothetical protein
MAIIDNFKNLFNPKKSLNDLKMDDLLREKIRLGQTEREFVKRVEEIEGKKKALFIQGKDQTSDRQMVILARQIKELDVNARNIDKSLQVVSQQQRSINGFIQLKENEKLLAQSGLSSMLQKVDLQTLQTYVQQASVDGEFSMDKLRQVVGTLEGSDTMPGAAEADSDVAEIVRQMQMAKANESDPAAVESAFKETNSILKSADKEEN